MKKLLHVIAQKPGQTGSGVTFEAFLDAASKREFHQGAIIGSSTNDNYVLPPYIVNNSCSLYPVIFETAQLPYPIPGMSDTMPYPSSKYSDLTGEQISRYKNAFKKILAKAFEEIRPDFIMTHHIWIASILTATMFPQAVTLSICHGTELIQARSCPYIKEYVIRNCGAIRAILALSSSQREEVIQLFNCQPERVHIIGGGIRHDLFFPPESVSLRHGSIKIVYVGKLSAAKGLPQLLTAFHILQKVFDGDMTLTVIGAGGTDEAKQFRMLAAEMSSKIQFTGALSQIEVANILRRADMLVLPSFSEGLGLVVLEAVACGCRVVVTELPSLRETLPLDLVSDGFVEFVALPTFDTSGFLKDDNQNKFIEDLASAIGRQVLQIRIKGRLPNEVARAIRERWSWDAVFERILSVYELTTKNPKG